VSDFTYKAVYQEAGRRVLEVNVLPEKRCNFDCVFCPIGRSHHQGDTPQAFEGTAEAIRGLERHLASLKPDLVFINAMGEALVNDRIGDIVSCVKAQGAQVRLLSNGYMLGVEACRLIANRCDEVIGEIKVAKEADFQKVQRPMAGYTLERHIENMASFRRQYPGTFILEVTLLKGYNDSPAAVETTLDYIRRISPHRLRVERMTDPRFTAKLGVADDRFDEIRRALEAAVEGRGCGL